MSSAVSSPELVPVLKTSSDPQTVTCECGAVCNKSYLPRHKQSAKHIRWEDEHETDELEIEVEHPKEVPTEITLKTLYELIVQSHNHIIEAIEALDEEDPDIEEGDETPYECDLSKSCATLPGPPPLVRQNGYTGFPKPSSESRPRC
jgi:hypothetical protein